MNEQRKEQVSKLFTGRIAYLIYIVASILLILVVKYQLDILKDKRHYEIKKAYEAY